MPKVHASVPPDPDGVIRFRSRVVGGKTSYVAIPAGKARGMQQASWPEHVNVHVSCAGVSVRFIGRVRFSVTAQITVPRLHDRRFNVEEVADVEISPVAMTTAADVEITPAAYASIDLALYAMNGVERPPGSLNLIGLRSQLRLIRRVRAEPGMWFAGFYLAEGSKSATANDVMVAQANLSLLKDCQDVLIGAFAIDPADISFEALYDETQDSTARETFVEQCRTTFGAQPTSVRKRTGRGRRCVVLHVRRSKELLRLLLRWFQDLACRIDAYDEAVAASFAIGLLDGDGGITFNDALYLDLYVDNKIADLGKRALTRAYGWSSEPWKPFKDREHLWPRRTLVVSEMADLLGHGAFRHSGSRARLLFTLADRIARVRPLWDTFVREPFTCNEMRDVGVDPRGRWKTAQLTSLPDGRYRLTSGCVSAIERFASHQREYEALRETVGHLDNAIVGVKGLENPLAETHPDVWQEIRKRVPWRMSGLTRVRVDQQTGAHAVHHPEEKTDQITKTLAGRTGLAIYEAHSGHGYLTEVYRKFGEVDAHTRKDGQDLHVLCATIATGKKYDVVDLDPYGWPLRLFFGGAALEILKPTGFLFMTFPNPRRNRAGKAITRQFLATIGQVRPTPEDAIDAVCRYGRDRGYQIQCLDQLDLGSVWRFAFGVKTITGES